MNAVEFKLYAIFKLLTCAEFAVENEIKTRADKLLKPIKQTARSRFNAAKRLESRDRKLTRLIAFSSAYVIILTILPYLRALPVEIVNNLNLATIGLSIIIIVSSLLQNASNNAVNAEQHHRSAMEMNEICRAFESSATEIDGPKLNELMQKYNHVLQKYSINHDTVDYELGMIQRPEEFQWLTWRVRQYIRVKIGIQEYIHDMYFVIITLITIYIVMFYAALR